MNSNQDSARRVVITGAGILSPIGIGVEEFRDNLTAGKSGIAPLDSLSYTEIPGHIGGEVKDFTESAAKKQYLKKLRKSIKVMCREIQVGVASAALALENAQLDLEQVDRSRLGVEFGANLMFSPPEVLKDACYSCLDDETQQEFVFEKWGTLGLQNMEPLWLLKYLPNMPACHVGIYANASGPSNSLTLAEASGNLAMGEAFRIITRGAADLMIAGSTGTRIHANKSMQAVLWDDLATAPEEAEKRSRPFDRDRTGQVLSEGACSFLLEEEQHARNRGANILGTVLGSASSCVIDKRGRPNIRKALANAMRSALDDAGLAPEEIGHINAHGLGTKPSDIIESNAILDVFGEYGKKVPVTALKSFMGNPGASCGSLELAGSILGLQQGGVPFTLNYENADPECPLQIVHGEPLPTENKTFLNINVTRMAQASALVASAN